MINMIAIEKYLNKNFLKSKDGYWVLSKNEIDGIIFGVAVTVDKDSVEIFNIVKKMNKAPEFTKISSNWSDASIRLFIKGFIPNGLPKIRKS